jgi:dsRNA-specific ribonuclease
VLRGPTKTREKAERILGHTFRNPDLLTESLTHASIADHRSTATSGWSSSATPSST